MLRSCGEAVLVYDQPVVVPRRQLPRLRKRRAALVAVVARPLDRVVVEQNERALKARNHQVLVVSRVRDDRRVRPVVHARQVLDLAAEADPQLVVVGRVVELRARDRALPYTESRSSDGVREFGDTAGSVVTPKREVVSKVMSWSTNWPTNVVPAMCAALFRLFALRLRSVIKSRGLCSDRHWRRGAHPAFRGLRAQPGPRRSPTRTAAGSERCARTSSGSSRLSRLALPPRAAPPKHRHCPTPPPRPRLAPARLRKPRLL